ncbi:general secretion pathway protein GspK [Myxococcota bacterium]|nr:general secretion pathway protein GspK [Myxococcota bacterium]
MSAPRHPLARLWRALTRPRSWTDLRGRGGLRTGGRGGQRSGVALLVVMTTVMIVTVVVTDLAYSARVRFLVAAHRTERRQAYWMARSGIEIYQLLILADRELDDTAGDMMESAGLSGLNIDGLLDMVPQLNTGLLTMLMATDGGSDLPDEEEELTEDQRLALQGEKAVSDELKEQALEEGGGLFSERSWLDMPGDFSAEVQEEDCRININLLRSASATTSSSTGTRTLSGGGGSSGTSLEESPTYQLMLGRMSGEDNDQWLRDRNLLARDLIANLADWVDADGTRSGGRGGYEDSLYQVIEPPYKAKNAAFDTQEEIRLVEGWTDEVYDRFADQFTIYGSGKLNISCEDDQIDWAILHSSFVESPPLNDARAQELIDLINEQRLLGFINTPKEYVDFLRQLGVGPKNELQGMLTDSASVFRITSTGLVGNSAVTITEVLQYDSRGRSTLLYHRVD